MPEAGALDTVSKAQLGHMVELSETHSATPAMCLPVLDIPPSANGPKFTQLFFCIYEYNLSRENIVNRRGADRACPGYEKPETFSTQTGGDAAKM